MMLKDLTLEEKIGQMLMVGIGSKKDIPNVINMIKNLHIGGVLLYKNNYDNYNEMVSLIKDLYSANKDSKIPLFIAIDQEGGIVNRMPDEFLNLYSAQKLALTNDKGIVKSAARITGKMLNDIGINLNFAPVLDLNNKNNTGLGNRCFSNDPKLVAEYSYLYMKELNKNKVISVVKHFPGHGSTNIDSHVLLPVIKEYRSLSRDLHPFKYAIDKKCDAIMISHMLIKDVDKYYPCSLSKKFIEEKIRKGFKFNGVIITDEVRMYGLRFLYGKDFAIRKAFFAGNDIVLFKYKKNDYNIINKLKKYIKDENILDEHVDRILKLKKKYNLLNLEEIKGCNINDINMEIKRVNEKVINKIV